MISCDELITLSTVPPLSFVFPLTEPDILSPLFLLYKMLLLHLLWVSSPAQTHSVPVGSPVYRYSLNKHITTANCSKGLEWFLQQFCAVTQMAANLLWRLLFSRPMTCQWPENQIAEVKGPFENQITVAVHCWRSVEEGVLKKGDAIRHFKF